MTTIDILDKDTQGILSFDLERVLNVIEPFSHGLEWYLIEFEPVGLLGSDGTEKQDPPSWVSSLFQQIIKAPYGTKVEWGILREFSRYVKQTIDLTLVGVRSGERPPSLPLDVSSPEHEIVVRGIDSSLWSITSRNYDVIERVRSSFRETRLEG